MLKLSCSSCGLEREISQVEAQTNTELNCPRCGHALSAASRPDEDVDASDGDITTLYVKETAEEKQASRPMPPAPSVDPFGATLVGSALAESSQPSQQSPQLWQPPSPPADAQWPPLPAAGAVPMVPPQAVHRGEARRGSTALSFLGLVLLFVAVATTVGLLTYWLFRTDLLR
jgi:hypothetical protein